MGMQHTLPAHSCEIVIHERIRHAKVVSVLMNFFGTHRLVRAICLLATLACAVQTGVAQDMANEQALRAAMTFNLLKFTEFPAEAIANTQRMRLCVAVGDPRQEDALAALSGRKVRGRELVVVRLAGQDGDCHALYVDSRQRWNVAADNHALSRALTISAYPGFVEDGGMVEIVLQASGTQFDINIAQGRRAGLRFAPQLLRLARHVHE